MTESIYVLEPGSYIRRDGNSLKVLKRDAIVDRIPCDGLKRLMLIGYISLSGGVLDFLIRRRVETVFITPTGRFRARLGLDEHKHVALRKAQYLSLSDAQFALDAARLVVRGKIESMYRLLLLRARHYKCEPLRTTAARLRPMAGSTHDIKDLDSLQNVFLRLSAL